MNHNIESNSSDNEELEEISYSNLDDMLEEEKSRNIN